MPGADLALAGVGIDVTDYTVSAALLDAVDHVLAMAAARFAGLAAVPVGVTLISSAVDQMKVQRGEQAILMLVGVAGLVGAAEMGVGMPRKGSVVAAYTAGLAGPMAEVDSKNSLEVPH